MYNLLHIATGIEVAPDTYAYCPSMTYDRARGDLDEIRAHETLLFRVFSRGQITVTRGKAVNIRGISDNEIELIVEFEACPWPCYVQFPRPWVNTDFVESSAAAAILRQTPAWSHEFPWLDNILTDKYLTRTMNQFLHPTITVVLQAVPMLQNLWQTWSLFKSQVRLRVGHTFNLVDADGLYHVGACKLVGIRAVERKWVEFLAFVCPVDVPAVQSQYIHLIVPVEYTLLSTTCVATYNEQQVDLTTCIEDSSVVAPVAPVFET